jgi:heat shock protein HtpX
VSDAPEPILVYNRIDANRRKTRLLLSSFVVVAIPVMSGATVYVSPWVFMIAVACLQIYGTPNLHAWLNGLLARVEEARSADGMLNLSQVPWPAILLELGFIFVGLIIVIVAVVAVTFILISRYGSRALLRVAGARPVGADQHPDLVQRVGNLCIGAGLPVPGIYLVDSETPNAFAVGRDPQHASLVVTRGLLALLESRELDGVIAHELSHIGNHDIRLSTALAAMVGTLTIPFRMLSFFFRLFSGVPLALKLVLLVIGFPMISALIVGYGYGIMELLSPQFPIHPLLWWWGLHAMLAPPYILFVAPTIALLIRQAVSREREFLADADAALLTRDPEGLALALVKVATARGSRLRVGEGSVHLYFADPMASHGSLMHWLFPSHPPVERRIELLARMGSGITPSDLQRARAAGAKAAEKASKRAEVGNPAMDPEPRRVASVQDENRVGKGPKTNELPPETSTPPSMAHLIPLYEQPDGWSRVIARLAPDASVTPAGRQGEFVRVLTHDNVTGYVTRSARLLAVQALEETSLS